jgi:serine phosphatase RsbU (regulator of sigma subunit)
MVFDRRILKERRLWHMVVVLPLVTIVPVLLMSIFAVSDSRGAIRQQVLQADEAMAQTVAAAVERYVQSELSRVEVIAREPDIARALSAKKPDSNGLCLELEQANRPSRELRAWAVANEAGTLVGNYPKDSTRWGRDVSTRDWFRGVKEAGWSRSYVSAIYEKLSPAAVKTLAQEGEKVSWVVALAAPVREGDRNLGVVIANLTLHDIASWVKPIQASSRTTSAYLVDQRGHLVFYPGLDPDWYSIQDDRNLTAVPPQLDHSRVSIVRDLLAGLPIRDRREVPDDPYARGTQLAWAVPVGRTGWRAIVQQSQAAAMAPVERLSFRLRLGTGVVVLLALCVAAALGLLERRAIAAEKQVLQSHHQYELALARAQRDADMAIGQEIQQSLLRLESRPGIDIECHSSPAQLVGGDFYSVFPIDGRRQGILIGDVSGKGVKAALYMTVATTLIQTLAKRGLSPASVLAAANSELATTMHRLKMYVTAIYGVLDLETQSLTFANAGHPPPMVRSGGEVEEAELYGFPLGVVGDSEYEERTIRLSPGDALVLYSDGLIEVRDDRKQMLGFEGLRELLSRSRAGSATRLMSDLLDGWRTVAGNRAAEDDLTLVIVRQSSRFDTQPVALRELAGTGGR